MSTYLNRRLDYGMRNKELGLKSSSRINEMKSTQLLTQSRKTRIQSTRGEKRKAMLEKRVVNSLTELIGSKNEGDYKNSLVFNILVTNIMNHFIESGVNINEESCLGTARKMAAFVSDIMKETYRQQRISQRVLTKSGSREDKSSRLRVREMLPRIPEERIKRVIKSALGECKRTPTNDASRSSFKSPGSNRGMTDFRGVKRAQSSSSRPTSATRPTSANRPTSRSSNKAETPVSVTDKDKLNSWLDNVSNRTKKWSEWIRQTVDKAESSKARVKSGESLKSVSEDWRSFVKDKKQESKALKESTSVIWKEEENAILKRRGQESIQQWLIKNKLNVGNKDRSNYSMRTSSSSESVYSIWSSRAPSSLFGGDSQIYKLKRTGMFK